MDVGECEISFSPQRPVAEVDMQSLTWLCCHRLLALVRYEMDAVVLMHPERFFSVYKSNEFYVLRPEEMKMGRLKKINTNLIKPRTN